MKSVLLSIQPKWCELIASGKKTVEVRKNKPKINTPFKCYVYCTKKYYKNGDGYFQGKYCGKIIGEFVCDKIEEDAIISDTCLTIAEILSYNIDKPLYFWHISDLVIYDNPKEIYKFKLPCEILCDECKYVSCDFEYNPTCTSHLSRPPQSWCYVEELI